MTPNQLLNIAAALETESLDATTSEALCAFLRALADQKAKAGRPRKWASMQEKNAYFNAKRRGAAKGAN